jgi:hypothetical protein
MLENASVPPDENAGFTKLKIQIYGSGFDFGRHRMRARMKLSNLTLSFVLASAVLLPAQNRPNGPKSFVGTWKLVSTEEKLRSGGTRPYKDLGANATGYIMYTADGHMCATLMKPGRPNWQSEMDEGTDAEKISAASGYTAYCGTYKVDEKNHIVWHFPEMSLYPNFIGTEQKRPYRFEGNRLILSDAVSEGEVDRWTIVWEKADARK